MSNTYGVIYKTSDENGNISCLHEGSCDREYFMCTIKKAVRNGLPVAMSDIGRNDDGGRYYELKVYIF